MAKGKLYIVSTPIGNLKDITKRAIEVLSNVDLIACEDTRITENLLKLLGISKNNLFSYHKHKENIRGEKLIKLLEDGKDIALVSDAGTPNISDPGIGILREAYKKNIEVIPIPGPSSLCVAISISPFTGEYTFTSFLPKGNKKKEFLSEKLQKKENLIFMESPKRVRHTLKIISEISPDREILCLRELTKIYEEIILSSSKKLFELFDKRNNIKGEFIFVVKGKEEDKEKKLSHKKLFEKYNLLKKEGFSHSESVKIISLIMDIKKNELYKLLLKGDR